MPLKQYSDHLIRKYPIPNKYENLGQLFKQYVKKQRKEQQKLRLLSKSNPDQFIELIQHRKTVCKSIKIWLELSNILIYKDYLIEHLTKINSVLANQVIKLLMNMGTIQVKNMVILL